MQQLRLQNDIFIVLHTDRDARGLSGYYVTGVCVCVCVQVDLTANRAYSQLSLSVAMSTS